MERSVQKHILVLITNPFAAINVIHSGLLKELGKHYNIFVMSDLMTASEVGSFNKHFQLNMQLLQTPIPVVSKFTKWMRAVQMVLFGHFFGLETIRIKVMERGAILHRLYCISRKSPTITCLCGALMVIVRNWLIRRTTQPAFCTPAGYNFQAVVSTSPLDLRENAISNSLRSRGIPNISVIISWDNLTSKGIINAKSDLVLVWNNAMALEYQRFYSVFGDDAVIRVGGVPRFDIYFREPGQDLNLHKPAGIDSRKQIILFSTGAAKHHSCQKYIINDLLRYSEIRPNIRILVRCHPGDDLRRYDSYNGIENLRFFQPFGEIGRKIPPIDFLEMLHCQLAGCLVCVQVASTMLLDAAAVGKPCISIAYDAHPGLHDAASVQRFYGYSHQLPLPDRLKAPTVRSSAELFAELDKILAGSFNTARLRDAVAPVIHHCAPDATRITAQHIREWLG